LCDTTGIANPSHVQSLFTEIWCRWPDLNLVAHFHNTRGMGLANVLAALESGIDCFDASLGGLGGCPFAPGASGNVCTEDLVHMLETMGYETGVELDALLGIAADLPGLVGHDVPSQVLKAGRSTRRYPVPGDSDASSQAKIDGMSATCSAVGAP
jgi:hydroxymethylglutaryl-CoA lyase